MAKRRQTLKVFRTPIGFHDAYVAAPSRKAALEAWGSGTDLFSSGAAEQVTDEKLMKAPLERPGEVIRVPRGSADEHEEALKSPKKKGGSRIKSGMTLREKPKRAELDRAEAALAELGKRHKAELRELAREEEALARRRRKVERSHEAEHDEASAASDRARSAYERAMRQWKKGA